MDDPIFGPLIEEVAPVMHPFKERLVETERVRAALALAEQKRIMIANGRLERRFIDGLGEVVASFSADVFHRLAAIYGYETVRSQDFLKAMLRDNPELRVKSRSTKIGIVVPCDWREGTSEGTSNASEGTSKTQYPKPNIQVDTAAVPLEPEDAEYFENVIAFPDTRPSPPATRHSA